MEQVKKIISVLVILGIGFLIMMFFIKTKQLPKEHPYEPKIPTVEVAKAHKTDESVIVSAAGNVVPSRQVVVIPEVTGKIIYHHKNLVPGGKINKGETILRINPKDYDLSIIQAKSNVALAEVKLTTEKGLKVVAEKEWNQIGGEVQPTPEGKQLALRELQVKSAEETLAAAKSGLELAQLRRDRTVIRSPFNAIVVSEIAEKGQFVAVGSQVATLVSTDAFWVRASLPADQLRWIDIPGVHAEEGSEVCVIQKNGEEAEIRRKGKVVKLMSQLDPQGRMAKVIIEVPNPLSIDPSEYACSGDEASDAETAVPMLLNDFVSVEIRGKKIKDSVVIPRSAIRNNNEVWVLTSDNTLEIRNVEIGFKATDKVFVTNGVAENENVITTRIKVPVKGMKLQVGNIKRSTINEGGPSLSDDNK